MMIKLCLNPPRWEEALNKAVDHCKKNDLKCGMFPKRSIQSNSIGYMYVFAVIF